METNSDDGYLADLPLWSDDEAKAILEEVCSKNGVGVDVLAELVITQRERQHQERAHGINKRFEEILLRLE
ncbi:DNA modification system-associated small protein [Paraburkholderia unamae]|uniref:DNA modification system-associated small protein n=1 Tax=Paraburkholderia unamae TaxID=219649 RepID=UPI000DD353F2